MDETQHTHLEKTSESCRVKEVPQKTWQVPQCGWSKKTQKTKNNKKTNDPQTPPQNSKLASEIFT